MILTKVNYERLTSEMVEQLVNDDGLKKYVSEKIAYYHSPLCGRIGCEEFEHLQGFCLGWNAAVEYLTKKKGGSQ